MSDKPFKLTLFSKDFLKEQINETKKNIEQAEPATPVEILGINGAAKAGDDFIVLESEKEAKSLCDARIQESKDGKNSLTFVTQDSAFKDAASEELNIIVKSDVHGSSEAIKNVIEANKTGGKKNVKEKEAELGTDRKGTGGKAS